MAGDLKELKWGVEQRLEFIEFRLFWEGGVNRADLIQQFGVSVPQASKDLAQYQELAPKNIRYDATLKKYVAQGKFKPRFLVLDPDAYLRMLVSREPADATQHVDVDVLPIPQRHIRPEILRVLLECSRDAKSVEVLYQSMNPKRADAVWRRISPHAFATDGMRWHTRAFCHIDAKFKDFLLSRCIEAREPSGSGAAAADDSLWSERFDVVLAPNPALSPAQQAIIVEDYCMKRGRAVVSVRRALLYYFSKRHRLDVSDRLDGPQETPVVVENRREFDAAMAEAIA